MVIDRKVFNSLELEFNSKKAKICTLDFFVYFNQKQEYYSDIDMRRFRMTKRLSSTTVVGTLIDNESDLIVLKLLSGKGLSYIKLDIPGYAKILGSTKYIDGLPSGYFRSYHAGKNLFDVNVGKMNLQQKTKVMELLIAYTKKYPTILNPSLCPQDIIINDNYDIAICAKVKEEKHKQKKVNVAFSFPSSITDSNMGVKYCLGSILYYLFSENIPYISNNPTISTSGLCKRVLIDSVEILQLIEDGVYPEFPVNFPKEIAVRIKKYWNKRINAVFKKTALLGNEILLNVICTS